MQRFILSKKNHIALAGAILIAAGFISGLGFKNETAAALAFVIASVIGVAPIAIQAYQALRVKVVSIDLLVTIAVIGAFFKKLRRIRHRNIPVPVRRLSGTAHIEQNPPSHRELTEMARKMR